MTIKLIDDYLDREIDLVSNAPNLINRFGSGIIVYTLPLFAIGILLDTGICVCLLFAAWSIGMFQRLKYKFSSGLYGWQEALLLSLTGIYFFDFLMIGSILLTGSVQIFDDILDYHVDQISGARNLVNYLGVVKAHALLFTATFLSWYIIGELFWPISTGIACTFLAFNLHGRVKKC